MCERHAPGSKKDAIPERSLSLKGVEKAIITLEPSGISY